MIICLALALGPPSLAIAEDDALGSLRAKIDAGIRILDDPELAGADSRAIKEEKLWRLSEQLFDYRTMTRLVMTAYWDELSPRQKDAFYTAFTGFLRRHYVPRLLERYDGQKLYYDGQRILSPSRAVVEVHVLWNELKIPFSINMIRRQDGWKIYDIRAVGVSAIKNYRAQFRWLMISGTFDQLIARLNARALPAS